jgi:hypothetical protein
MHSEDDAKPYPEKKARWKKCPICWDSIYQSDVRPVRFFAGQEGSPPRPGEDVVLRLIKRQPGSTLALPRDGADTLAEKDEIPWYFAAEVADYARVMKGTEEYMMSQYDEEILELQRQEREDEVMFGEETQWTRKAVNAINEAKEMIKGIGNAPGAPTKPAQPIKQLLPSDTTDANVPEMYLIQHAAKSGVSIPTSIDCHGLRSISGTDSLSDSEVNVAATSSSVSAVASSTPKQDKSAQWPGSLVSISSTTEKKGVPVQPSTPMLPTSSPKPASLLTFQHESPYFFYQALLHYYLSPWTFEFSNQHLVTLQSFHPL